MENRTADIESATISDILGLASWNRPRTSEELQTFITSRHAALPDDSEIE